MINWVAVRLDRDLLLDPRLNDSVPLRFVLQGKTRLFSLQLDIIFEYPHRNCFHGPSFTANGLRGNDLSIGSVSSLGLVQDLSVRVHGGEGRSLLRSNEKY